MIKKWVGYKWNMQLRIHPNWARFILFSGVCVTPGLWWLIQYFFHICTKRLLSAVIFKTTFLLLSSPFLIFVLSDTPPLFNIFILPILPTILPTLCSSSSLRGPLLRAVWCHPLPGVARLLQRLFELWVGHWGWTGTFHQDQLWQVCMTVLQQLNRGNEDTPTYTKTQTKVETAHIPLCMYPHTVLHVSTTQNIPIYTHTVHVQHRCVTLNPVKTSELQTEIHRNWNADLDLVSKNDESLEYFFILLAGSRSFLRVLQ